MPSYAFERGRFTERLRAAGASEWAARRLLRLTNTAQRLAVAACNGDYPANNGERRTRLCPECGCGWAPESFRKGVCPDCRTEALIRETVASLGDGWGVETAGDPRGAVVKLIVPGMGETPWGEPRTLAVPTRYY